MSVGWALAFSAAAAASWWAAPGWSGLIGAALAAIMLAIARSDWRSYRVPDRLTALALGLRTLDLALSPTPAFGGALLGALASAAAFYLFRAGYRRLRGREGLGLGDVKLAAVAGAWVEPALLPWVIEAAAIFGLALALRRGALRADARVPFAVGFAPSIWLGWWLGRLNF